MSRSNSIEEWCGVGGKEFCYFVNHTGTVLYLFNSARFNLMMNGMVKFCTVHDVQGRSSIKLISSCTSSLVPHNLTTKLQLISSCSLISSIWAGRQDTTVL